jgi:hypothetical protein
MADYIRFWFEGGGSPNSYTFWVATSTWANYQITGNASLLGELYPAIAANYWNGMCVDWRIDLLNAYVCVCVLQESEGCL